MARKVVTGRYVNTEPLEYCFFEEDGTEFVRLKAGDKYFLDDNFYYKIEEISKNGKKILEARNWCKARKALLVQPLVEGKFFLATTVRGAIKSLYTLYKEYEKDELYKVLEQSKFIPGCVVHIEELADADIALKVTNIPTCPNFLGANETYEYYVLTDATEMSDIRVTPESCITCRNARRKKNKDFRCDMMRTIYRQYLNGTYIVLMRKKVGENKKQIESVYITPMCNRDELASRIKNEM